MRGLFIIETSVDCELFQMNLDKLHQLSVQLVNGLGGDPAVLVQLNQSSDCVLFDAGSLDVLSNRELLRIRVVAVSHTHLDHFIGFDRLIRVNVPHFRTVELVGPTGIIDQLKNKLNAYTWNLLSPGQLNFVVHEVGASGHVTAVRITNDNNFDPIPLQLYEQKLGQGSTNHSQINLTSISSVILSAVVVDHGTDVLSFCLSTLPSFVVSKTALTDLNLTPGRWINQLQTLVASGRRDGTIDVFGQNMEISRLAEDVLTERAGERIAYVTDLIFSPENLVRLKNLMGAGVDLLICESNFLHCDRSRAHKKFHLTTRQAALLAAALQAKHLQVFHLSNIYSDRLGAVEQEAMDAFENLRQLQADDLAPSLSKEFIHP